MISGAALMVFAGGASGVFTSLLVAVIVAYDAYHKPWAGSVVVMGACRTLLYLAAGSAVSNHHVLEEGLTLGAYVVGLTLAARSETPGKLKGCAALFGLTLLYGSMVAAGGLGLINVPSVNPLPSDWPFGIAAVALFGWTTLALRHISKGGREIGTGVGMLLAGIPLIDGLMISQISPATTLVFLALVPLLRLWQRWIAAT
jgi:4-hydroxybenzoate polyprenyltransferase